MSPSPHRQRCRGILRLLRAREGTSAVEFALVATPLLLFLFGIIEMGRVLWAQNTLHYAVEEASRYASVNGLYGASCTSANQTAVQNYAAAHAVGIPATFTYTCPNPSCGSQVTASYAMSFATLFVNMPLTLTSQACFPTS